jgi:hypothetical protein
VAEVEAADLQLVLAGLVAFQKMLQTLIRLVEIQPLEQLAVTLQVMDVTQEQVVPVVLEMDLLQLQMEVPLTVQQGLMVLPFLQL